jgi:peptidoglycan/LPS O-acetylase OafA/YrhL
MVRFLIVALASAAVIVGLVVPKLAALGLTAGVLVGAAFFFIAMSTGQGIVSARLVKDRNTPNDPNASISMGLGAAGIACSAYGTDRYPHQFQMFLLFCAIAGATIALVAAWRHRTSKQISAPAPVDGDSAS